jgi:hypothetical protein
MRACVLQLFYSSFIMFYSMAHSKCNGEPLVWLYFKHALMVHSVSTLKNPGPGQIGFNLSVNILKGQAQAKLQLRNYTSTHKHVCDTPCDRWIATHPLWHPLWPEGIVTDPLWHPLGQPMGPPPWHTLWHPPRLCFTPYMSKTCEHHVKQL